MASVLSPNAPPQKSAVPRSHPFTCNTCQVAFRSHEQQRSHHHTDWHQYNLKRKVASLPPLTSETFAEKVLNAQATSRIERERATFERLCKVCGKVYYSENAYTNHLASQKHRQNVQAAQVGTLRSGGGADASLANPARVSHDQDDSSSVVSSTFSLGEPEVDQALSPNVGEDVTGMVQDLNLTSNESSRTPQPQSPDESVVGVAEGEPTELPLEACLFCNYVSPSLQLNVSHMTKAHGLFIPELPYLVDLEGLVRYLGQKLLLGNQCLYCNKTKGGLEGIRTHMRDKGHMMLGFDTEEQQVELGQFYDFRSTYSDAGEESSTSDDEELAPAGQRLKPRGPGEDEGWEAAEDGNGGEGWETDSDASSIDSTELTAVPVDPSSPRRKSKDGRHHLSDGWHSHAHHMAWHDEYELHLPSGRSAGHRSLAKYYRQNLRNRGTDSKEVKKITDTPYPRGQYANADDEEGDEEEGGVPVSENGDRQVARAERREADRLAMVSRANGGLGMAGVSAAKRKEVQKIEKKSRDEEQRGRRRYEWGNEKRGNMQKHYRDPLLQ